MKTYTLLAATVLALYAAFAILGVALIVDGGTAFTAIAFIIFLATAITSHSAAKGMTHAPRAARRNLR